MQREVGGSESCSKSKCKNLVFILDEHISDPCSSHRRRTIAPQALVRVFCAECVFISTSLGDVAASDDGGGCCAHRFVSACARKC